MRKIIVMLLVVLSTVVADINTITWVPDEWKEQDLRYLCVDGNRAFVVGIAHGGFKKNVALYVVDIEDKNNMKILGKCNLAKRLGKSAFHWNMGCRMLHKDGYVYIVPAGSYQTSVLIFDARKTDNLEFVREIPLFHERTFVHYVEIPQSVEIYNDRLFVQMLRGVSIIDIRNTEKSVIVQEVDDIEVLAVEDNSLCYAYKNDALVFFHEDVNTPIQNLNYVNSDLNNKVGYRVSSCIGQLSAKSLFVLEKRVDNKASFYLQMLQMDKKKLPHNKMNCQSWEWQKVENGTSNFPYFVMQYKEKVSLYELVLEKKPQLVADLKLENVSSFVLQDKHLYACTADGFVVVSGW